MSEDVREWGPEIRVDGVRPAWLEPSIDVPIKNVFGDWRGPVDYFDGDNVGWAWRNITHIRLPANHPHYAAQEPRTAPSGGEVGAEVVTDGKPAYTPPHKLPCWLSSEDVKTEIMNLAANGADKAVCWDMMQAVYRLADRALEKEAGR